jgi:GNAT superfamily N-acetyltransferase
VSDPLLDELAESARNRGLRLVRSRVRTPGKRRFGKVGLADAAGKPVFGMDDKGPTAAPDAVEQFLRNLGARDWGASLDVAVLPRKPKARTRQPANDAQPKDLRAADRPKASERRAAPKLKIREAKGSDAPRLAKLLHELGHEIEEKDVKRNLASLRKSGAPTLVATLDKEVVGMCGIGRQVVIHRPAPLGRITVLVVTREAQRHGIGRQLVEAAETWMRKEGCQLAEVTSNDRRTAAHAFYRHLGYERSSIRFFKKL